MNDNTVFHLRRQANEALALVAKPKGPQGGWSRDQRDARLLRHMLEALARNVLAVASSRGRVVNEREPLCEHGPGEPDEGACDTASRIYLLCPSCGFFFGAIRLWPGQQAVCHECGTEPLLAYDDIEKALAKQEEVRARG